jgi:hypothetical protein
VNPKKELFAASLLAIALAAGLGTISSGLFAEAPPNVRIDVFSKRNGAASTSFLPSDQVLLEAQVSHKNASIAGAPVTFEVKTPNSTDFLLQTVPTDHLGTANITFQIPWPSGLSLGTWQTQVASEIYGQTLNATTNFECRLLPPVIDVYTQKGGYGPNMADGTFALNETISLYAEIRDQVNHTVPNQLVAFEVRQYEGSFDHLNIQTTNASGIASITHPIPPGPAYAGTYEAYVSAKYNGIILIDTLTFTQQP